MFFLAGLLGMMMLGSFAVVSTGEPAEDEGGADLDADGFDIAEEPSAQNAPLSLFEQMGLGTDQADEPDVFDDGGIRAEGSDDDDVLTGTDGIDLLNGADGKDDVSGGFSGDEVRGGAGDDRLWGDAGDDTLHGDGGRDVIEGGADADELFGHDGDDELYGNDGHDTLWGGLGDDSMSGDVGNDALHGREGADTLIGGAGEDTLFGGWGDDYVDGREGELTAETDFLNGGDGSDILVLGPGDVASGGDDADTFFGGAWLATEAARLMDFDPGEDQLVIVYDDSDEGAEPEVDMRVNADDPNSTDIYVDDAHVMSIPTEDVPAPEAIVLVGESAAASLGML